MTSTGCHKCNTVLAVLDQNSMETPEVKEQTLYDGRLSSQQDTCSSDNTTQHETKLLLDFFVCLCSLHKDGLIDWGIPVQIMPLFC